MTDMSTGQILLDIPPKKGNPRNSEGAFLRLKNGDLLFMYSEFHGESDADHAGCDIVKIVSSDEGLTWTAPETVVSSKDSSALNVMSISLLPLRGDAIGLFYLLRKSRTEMRVVLRRSNDQGATWSDAVCCIPRPGHYVINNDRVVRLSTGRILLPLAEHPITMTGDSVSRYAPGMGCFFYSDDDGESWRESEFSLSLNVRDAWGGFQEPGVIELKGGLLWCWARTSLGRQYECYSRDGGKQWSAPSPSVFTSPLSPLSMKRLPDGRLFAIWNPIPEYQTRVTVPRTGGRTPLVYALSSDEGVSWSSPTILEDDPNSGYCYTAIYPSNDYLFLSYCAGNTEKDTACLNRTRIRRIPLSSL